MHKLINEMCKDSKDHMPTAATVKQKKQKKAHFLFICFIK